MLSPVDEDQLAEAVRTARGPLSVRCGGTRMAAAGAGEVLSVAGLRGITLYEPGALTLVARAGTPVVEVEQALAEENQRLAFEPMDHRRLLGRDGTPTMGGVVAMNASGPRRIQVGACRDSLIGVRFVDGTGEIIKNGGRVMKNVTGYDLVKLMAGSRGTLGVLSEVSFKVLPGVAASATLIVADLPPRESVAAMSAALRSPFEVSGAARLPDGRIAIRVEGFDASVAYRARQLETVLADFGSVSVEEQHATNVAFWADIRDAAMFAGGDGDIWRISVKPSDGPGVIEQLGDRPVLMDWGGGLLWVDVAPGTDLRVRLQGVKGHATLVRAAPETHARLGTLHPEPAPIAALSEGLRARFDPRGLFSTHDIVTT